MWFTLTISKDEKWIFFIDTRFSNKLGTGRCLKGLAKTVRRNIQSIHDSRTSFCNFFENRGKTHLAHRLDDRKCQRVGEVEHLVQAACHDFDHFEFNMMMIFAVNERENGFNRNEMTVLMVHRRARVGEW